MLIFFSPRHFEWFYGCSGFALCLQIVLFLLSICLFASIACGLWEYKVGKEFEIFLPWESIIPSEPLLGAIFIAILVFFSYGIVLNTLVPISLYVRWVWFLPVCITMTCLISPETNLVLLINYCVPKKDDSHKKYFLLWESRSLDP